VAFLCKYSIDQGWITPAIRVVAGGAIGAALIGLGIRTHRSARPFSALFLGGGIGAWYTAIYASYALYHLTPFPVAMGLMLAATLAAFGLALWSEVETLAVVGALGGLATPFVLTTSDPSVPQLVAYLSFILALTSGIHLARGWRKNLAVGAVGTWMALASVPPRLPPIGQAPLTQDRIALTLGYAAVLLAGWAVFLLLPRLAAGRFRAVEGRTRAAHAWWASAAATTEEHAAVAEGHAVVALAFFAAWASVVTLWELDPRPAGYIGAGIALACGLAYAALRERHPALARAHAFAGALAGGLAVALASRNVPEGAASVVAFGALLHAWSDRRPLGRPVRLAAHAAMLFAALSGAVSLLISPGELNARLAMLVVAVCAYAAAAEWVSGLRPEVRDRYRVAGHAAAAVLVWSLCEPLQYAGGWFAVSASAFAAALFVVERQRDGRLVPGRPVDGGTALVLQAAALVAALSFCGEFGAGGLRWFNERAAAELALLASLAAGAWLAGTGARRRRLYAVGYGLWLFTVADQFHGLSAGPAFTTGVWAATGLALLVVALPLRDRRAVRVALGTLALVCGKLLLADLASLDAIWRILVFLGVGAAFLAVSYYVRSAWMDSAPETAAAPAGAALAEP
jgi:uncharacterized membrane protein